jgi:TonB family protein
MNTLAVRVLLAVTVFAIFSGCEGGPRTIEPTEQPRTVEAADDRGDAMAPVWVPPPPPDTDSPVMAGVGDVTNPKLVPESRVEPRYPESARTAQLNARVVLKVTVLSDGRVEAVEVIKSNRPGFGFEESAIEAVKRWRFEPARRLSTDEPVKVHHQLSVEFTHPDAVDPPADPPPVV